MFKKLAILTIALFASVSARAETVAALNFSGGLLAAPAADQLYGWFFAANHTLDVIQLGVFDSGGDGLGIAHEVGIFRVSDRALLGSATVPSGTTGTLVNSFRYVSVAPLELLADEYVIVMTMPNSSPDGQFINNLSVTTSPDVTLHGAAFIASHTLIYPSWDASVFGSAMIGPNFVFAS